VSDTPETDAHSPHRYSITGPDGVTTHFVPADFARGLERQRNQGRALLAEMQDAIKLATKYLLKGNEP
jgi:hypothetical protein